MLLSVRTASKAQHSTAQSSLHKAATKCLVRANQITYQNKYLVCAYIHEYVSKEICTYMHATSGLFS